MLALAAPFFYGVSNILDNYLSNRLFKNTWTLAFCSVFLNVLYIPFVWFVEKPGIIPLSLVPFCLLVGLIETVYPYPYYKALQMEDTSVVSALFAIGKIFVPMLAFVFLGEQLAPIQYAGFFLIIFSCVALSLTDVKTLRFNKAFFSMLFCSLILSIEVIIYKHLFEQVSWSTGFVWTGLFTLLPTLGFLLIPSVRRDLRGATLHHKRIFGVFALEEFFAFLANTCYTYAVSLISVTVVKSVGEVQPLFVLLLTLLFGRLFPGHFRERVDRGSLAKKGLLFICIIVGIVLVSLCEFE